MAKKVYNTSSLGVKKSKPKTTKEVVRNPKNKAEQKKTPTEGLDSYAYGLDNNIYLL